jgi:hypothetical protein
VKLAQVDPASTPTQLIDLPLFGSAQKVPVGIRLLTISERSGVYKRAKAKAKELGVETWSDEDHVCALELYVETVAACTFDGEEGSFEPWATADQLRNDRSIGQDSLLFIYEAYEAFEQKHSLRPEDLQGENFLTTLLKAGAGDLRPLGRMRRGTLEAFTAILASELLSSQIAKSSSTSSSGSTAGSTPMTAGATA